MILSKAIITKHLSAVTTSGRKTWTVLEDWLDIVHATLRMLPQHALMVATTGKPADDPDDIKATWARLNQDYKAADWRHFQAATIALLDVVEQRVLHWGDPKGTNIGGESWDVIGDIYQELNASSDHSGQYFTPWHLAHAAAQMSVGETMESLAARTEPLRISDPACGSGVMLLAAAACLPREAVQKGLVKFYGQDIDPTCVKLAQINMMLYGLNGWGRRWRDAGIVLESVTCETAAPGPVADIELPIGQLSLL